MKFKGLYPADIELAFRRALGSVNPYMCALDVAASEFQAQIHSQAKPGVELNRAFGKYGHRLFIKPDELRKAHRFLTIAHLAYILSAADAFCTTLRKHPSTSEAAKKSAIKGDLLRKTVFAVMFSGGRIPNSDLISDEELSSIIPPGVSEALDYYRKLRNDELHGLSTGDDDTQSASFAALDIEAIKKEFHLTPSPPDKLGINDVLLFSLAWQKAAKSLCRALTPVTTIMEILPHRFGNLSFAERRRAAINFLQQKFLMDEKAANGIILDLKWTG